MAKTVDQYFDELRDTRVWRSIFRSGTGSSTLKRSLAIQQNVFLHLFSTKVRRRMLSFSATWYLGTLTLGTFLILVVTGILLMLYYHPSVPQAYADTKDLQFVVSSGLFLRNLHRWSAHAMVFLVFAHMFKVFYRGAYRPPREFNWVIGIVSAADHSAAELHRISVALGSTGVLGDHGRFEHRFGRAGVRRQDSLHAAGRQPGQRERAAAVLRAALHDPAAHGDLLHRDSLLADPQGRGLYAHQSEPSTVNRAALAKEAQ